VVLGSVPQPFYGDFFTTEIMEAKRGEKRIGGKPPVLVTA
jgi:hypothetical protein